MRDAGGTFGMTLRGGASVDPGKCRPLTVTQIRSGGPADRCAQYDDTLSSILGRIEHMKSGLWDRWSRRPLLCLCRSHGRDLQKTAERIDVLFGV